MQGFEPGTSNIRVMNANTTPRQFDNASVAAKIQRTFFGLSMTKNSVLFGQKSIAKPYMYVNWTSGPCVLL